MINPERLKTNSSLLGGLSLALISTTCCALPIVLVALGMGSAVASLATALPWIVFLSEYKIFTFGFTAAILAYCFWRLSQVGRSRVDSQFAHQLEQGSVDSCDIADSNRLQWQRLMLWASTGLLIFSLFAAYALLPITLWWEGS